MNTYRATERLREYEGLSCCLETFTERAFLLNVRLA